MATPQIAKSESEHRKDIDGLRAIAVVAVIVNHLNHAVLPGGYLGVDIFFVISGFVITSSLETRAYSSLGSQLLEFYSRRIKRLMPALLTMSFVTSALIRLFDPHPLVSTITGIASTFGAANLFLFSEAVNYFGKSAQLNAFSHTWSLAVEEQFYLLYPLLLRWGRPVSGWSLRNDRFRLSVLAAISGVSLLLFIVVYRTNQPAAYFLTPFRFWELGSGCLLALVSRSAQITWIAHTAKLNAAVPLLAMLPALLLADRFPVACTVLIVISTACLIGSVRPGTVVYRLLASRLAVYLGAVSYSLYLWHWPVICISRWTIGIHLWTLPFQIAAILALSTASYHLIENRLRRATWVGGRWGTIAAGVPAMAATALLIFLGQRYSLPTFSGDRSAEATINSPVTGYVARYSRRRVDDCFAATVFRPRGQSFRDNLEKCDAESGASIRLIFVGDSHATDMFPMADRIYKDRVASVLNVFQTGCRVPRLATEADICGYPELIMKTLGSKGAASNILVIRNNYSPRWVSGELADFSKRMDALLARTSAAGMKVIYIAPAPKYYDVGSDRLCSRQWYRPDWAMDEACRNGFLEDRGEELARRRDVTEYLLGLSRQRSDFFVFDPFDVLCGASQGHCTPMRNGRLIYRDESHLTEEGSDLLAAPFEAFLSDHHLLDVRAKPANGTP